MRVHLGGIVVLFGGPLLVGAIVDWRSRRRDRRALAELERGVAPARAGKF